MQLKEIKTIIKEEVESLAAAKLRSFDEDIFFKSGLIDSLGMLSLIIFLEQRFNVEIDAFYNDRKAVSSVNKLARMIKAKLKSKGN